MFSYGNIQISHAMIISSEKTTVVAQKADRFVAGRLGGMGGRKLERLRRQEGLAKWRTKERHFAYSWFCCWLPRASVMTRCCSSVVAAATALVVFPLLKPLSCLKQASAALFTLAAVCHIFQSCRRMLRRGWRTNERLKTGYFCSFLLAHEQHASQSPLARPPTYSSFACSHIQSADP